MKKYSVGLVALATLGTSFAQSTVTLFGVADVNYQNARQGGATINRINGSGSTSSSRLGFRGVEDLGDGLFAGFWLESGMSVDTGSGAATSLNNQTATTVGGLVFNRRSTVSLSSERFGEIRLGRDYAPSFWNIGIYDPFGAVGSGTAKNLTIGALNQSATVQTSVWVSNSIGYFLPTNLGGVYGQAMYALGENASNAVGGTQKDGNFASFRLGYAKGAMDMAVAYGNTKLASGDVKVTSLGGSYNLGFAKIMGQVFSDRRNAAVVNAANRSNGWIVGATIPVGVGTIPVSFGNLKDNSNAAAGPKKASQIAIGYVHNLSKRTAIYTTYSMISNKNGAALSGGGVTGVAGANWTGLDFGLRHSF